MTVTAYRSTKYEKTTSYVVEKITAMPEPDVIEDEDRESADGIMLTLWLRGGGTVCIPHSFLIEIT